MSNERIIDERGGWFISAKHLNDLQRESVAELLRAAKGMSHADVSVRKNGQYLNFQIDWMKYLLPIDGVTAEARAGHALEEFQCVTRCLDHYKVPASRNGKELSLWGRICELVDSGFKPESKAAQHSSSEQEQSPKGTK